MAFFVAFYSYKGGVGRSLALANTAYSLAARGKRVVLLDLDLEAPSLQEFPELALRGSGVKRGFLEYAASYRKRGWCPEISRYVHPCKESPGLGKLWLMPSGALGSSYQEQLGTLSWSRLHPKKGTEPFVDEIRSALLQEFAPDYILIDSRTGLSDIGGLSTHRLADMVVLVFNLTRPSIEGSVRAYRSFTSEGSRVQTVQLVASPVPPLVPGAGSIVERRLNQAVELMPHSTAFGRTLLRIEYDPAMVLAEELAVRNPEAFPAVVRYEALREAIQRANPEEVFPVLEQARQLRAEGLLEDGLSLLRSFTVSHPQNAEGFLELGNFAFEAGRAADAAQAFRKACDLAPDLSLAHRRLGEALAAAERTEEAIEALQKAEVLGDRTRELYRAMARAYELKQDPAKEVEARRKAMLAAFGSPRAAEKRVFSSADLGDLKREFIDVLTRRPPYPGFRPEAFWDGVMRSLDMSLPQKVSLLKRVSVGEIKPTEISGLIRSFEEEDSRWSDILGPETQGFRRALAEKGADPFNADEVLALQNGERTDAAVLGFVALNPALPFDRRLSLLKQALQKAPDNHALLNILGTALGERASSGLVEPEGRSPLLLEASSLFERSLELKPGQSPTLYNWGVALQALADLAQAADKHPLLLQAASKYEQALQIKPGHPETLNNWGNTLWALAKLAQGEEQRPLLLLAASKYEQALQIKPNFHKALYNWGIALAHLAALAEPDAKRSLLLEAVAKFQQVNQLSPSTGDYGLAYALSLLGRFDEAASLLTHTQRELPAHALDDPDLQPLWAARPDLKEEIAKRLYKDASRAARA